MCLYLFFNFFADGLDQQTLTLFLRCPWRMEREQMLKQYYTKHCVLTNRLESLTAPLIQYIWLDEHLEQCHLMSFFKDGRGGCRSKDLSLRTRNYCLNMYALVCTKRNTNTFRQFYTLTEINILKNTLRFSNQGLSFHWLPQRTFCD